MCLELPGEPSWSVALRMASSQTFAQAVGDGALTVSGTLTVSDVDSGEAEFVAQSGTAGSYHSFTLGTDGFWSYSADNSQAAVQTVVASPRRIYCLLIDQDGVDDPAVVSRMLWKFPCGVLRACERSVTPAARSRGIGSRAWDRVSHPSTFRIWICPEANSAQRSIGTVSAHGSTVWVLMRRRNSSFSRSMAFVVRADFHCDGSRRVKVKSRSPASFRLSATARHLRRHFRRNALRRVSMSAAVSAYIMSRYRTPAEVFPLLLLSACRKSGSPSRRGTGYRSKWTQRRSRPARNHRIRRGKSLCHRHGLARPPAIRKPQDRTWQRGARNDRYQDTERDYPLGGIIDGLIAPFVTRPDCHAIGFRDALEK
ncbi:VCBS repeat-containing protein [Salipiger marinus]|uniref:VCBS repeat-containing protein n=1 Tax=Salipiger marinus TaxID=555512 RepID=A0A1G8TBZ3_9RHOB|nr:VCBS repeat-containing protein [Salipiger marinus]